MPRGSQLLLLGPPGVAKTLFAIRYLADRIEKNEPCVFATTLWSPDQVRFSISQHLAKNTQSDLLVVDGVTCITAQASAEPYAFQNLYDLNTINLILLQAIADAQNGHLCIDNLTTLMTYSAPHSVIKFLQVLSARVKDHGVTGIYLVESGVQTREILRTLQFSVDGMFEVRDEEVEGRLVHRLRLAHLRGIQVDTRWLTFQEKTPLWLDF
ncbi:MAG: RAD55 family ATPase [Promethearchaeota archaeon]